MEDFSESSENSVVIFFFQGRFWEQGSWLSDPDYTTCHIRILFLSLALLLEVYGFHLFAFPLFIAACEGILSLFLPLLI